MSDRDVNSPSGARPFLLQSTLARSLHFAAHETQSRMWLRDPYALALKYTQTMMGFLLFQPRPGRIGMIGLGGGSLAKFCYRYLPDARIEAVEINPQVLALRETFLVPPDDERFQAHLADGADYIRGCKRSLDVLLVDGYDRDGIAQRLCTQSFYDDCRRSLRPGGLMIANIICAHAQYDLLIERIRTSFGKSVLIVQDSESSNDVVFAWVGEIDDSRLDGHKRPPEIDPEAWEHLGPAMDRVRFAWQGRPWPAFDTR